MKKSLVQFVSAGLFTKKPSHKDITPCIPVLSHFSAAPSLPLPSHPGIQHIYTVFLEHFTGQTWDGLKGEMTWEFKSVAQVQTEVWESGVSTSLSSIAWTLSEGRSAPDTQLWTLFILLLIVVRYLLFLLVTFVKPVVIFQISKCCLLFFWALSIYQHICYSGHLTKLKILNSWIQHGTDKPFV